ncbi:MAG: hypothetical protein ACYTFO_11680, partial [Planctomycetota bacterium]
MFSKHIALRVTFVVSLLTVSFAQGGILATDTNAMAAWQGTESIANGITPPWYVSADVDYAVYAPGQFDATFGAGADPSGGSEYVYAYQVHNDPTGSSTIKSLSIGLDGDSGRPGHPVEPLNGSPLGYVGFLDDVLYGDFGLDPDFSRAVPPSGPPSPTSMRWDFEQAGLPTLLQGMSSDILLFTSPAPPEWDSGTLDAGFAGSGTFPSPSPEPATMGLLALGGIA